MDTDAAAELNQSRLASSNAFAVFSVTWAAATLFHVWGGSRLATDLLSGITLPEVSHVLAGIAAIAVFLRPRRIEPVVALALFGLWTLWFEAPFLGSHWVVAALVDIAFLLALAATRGRRPVEAVFFPLARWVLIGFYSFAAFAKLNHAFFTPTVSCGNFYVDELAASLHFDLHTQSHLVPFMVAGVELSVPILLLLRRTRPFGVVLGLLFHGMIALDQLHLFSDFSSVLVALFLLFLPAAFADDVIDLFRRLGRQGCEVLRALVVVGCAALLVLMWGAEANRLPRVFNDGLGWAWVVYWLLTLGLAARFVWRHRPTALEQPWSFSAHGVPRWMAVVPILVLLTGLSPYLELRTAYAFNMYSNLQTVDGESNHFIVTKTLPLTDFQADLVQIVASSDGQLREYATQRFEIPFLQLRDYLSRHHDVSLTYVRKGVQQTVDRVGDDPELVAPVPSWESKLFAFRSVDETSPARCQPSFLAAL